MRTKVTNMTLTKDEDITMKLCTKFTCSSKVGCRNVNLKHKVQLDFEVVKKTLTTLYHTSPKAA